LWPAFWMLARGWPPEDDVAEFWTGRPRPHTHQGFAYRDRDGAVKWESRHEDHIREGFHTFGLEWGPGYQLFNRDGVVTVRVYGRQVPGAPMYLILNSGVAAKPGPTAATVFPNAFTVDYVRVYARPKDAIAFHNTGFEDDTAEPWSLKNGASVDSRNAHTGQRAIRLPAGGAIAQAVYDLQPNTKHEVKCWLNADADSDVRLSVTDFVGDHGPGEATATSTKGATGYHELTATFTTGPRPTSALITCTQAATKGIAYIDDFSVTTKATAP
jgi:beta-glucanase (GH16 family)